MCLYKMTDSSCALYSDEKTLQYCVEAPCGYYFEKPENKTGVYKKMSRLIVTLVLICALSVSWLSPPPAKAVVGIIPAIGVACLIGTLFVAAGITFSSNDDFRTAINTAYNNAGNDLKAWLSMYAGVHGLAIPALTWNTLIYPWLSSIFTSKNMTSLSPDGSALNCYMTTSAYDTVHHNTTPVLWSMNNTQATNQIIPLAPVGLATATMELQRQGTSVVRFIYKVVLPNGNIMTSGNDIAFAGYETITRYHSPIIATGTGYSVFVPHMESWYTLVGTDQWSDKYFNTWSLNGNLLRYESGYVRYTVGAQTYNIGTQNQYHSLQEFAYQTIVAGQAINIAIDGQLYDEYVRSIPTDRDVYVTVPNTTDLEAVRTAVAEAVAALTAASVIPSAVPDVNTGEINADKFKMDPLILMQKFPFCIPFDIVRSVQNLQAPAVCPRWEMPFNILSIGVNEKIVIDFTDFSFLASIVRWFLSIIFVISLAILTRRIINN